MKISIQMKKLLQDIIPKTENFIVDDIRDHDDYCNCAYHNCSYLFKDGSKVIQPLNKIILSKWFKEDLFIRPSIEDIRTGDDEYTISKRIDDDIFSNLGYSDIIDFYRYYKTKNTNYSLKERSDYLLIDNKDKEIKLLDDYGDEDGYNDRIDKKLGWLIYMCPCIMYNEGSNTYIELVDIVLSSDILKGDKLIPYIYRLAIAKIPRLKSEHFDNIGTGKRPFFYGANWLSNNVKLPCFQLRHYLDNTILKEYKLYSIKNNMGNKMVYIPANEQLPKIKSSIYDLIKEI
jgi:hypothetical protein